MERAEWTSLSQLVQEIICGAVRRHTFTQWDLELLFDLQNCKVRKSARPDLLRRYVRAVQQHFASGATRPLRLSAFLETEGSVRNTRSALTHSNPNLEPVVSPFEQP